MTADTARIARAFSGHRFADAYAHLAPDVEWNVVGGDPLHGRESVVAACDALAADLDGTNVRFDRFLVIADGDAAVVDAVAVYTDTEGGSSSVSLCDLYEFVGGAVARITSYNIELST